MTAMKKQVMNFDEFSTVTATTFYFFGSFNGLCNCGIIYEHLRLQLYAGGHTATFDADYGGS